MGDLVVVFGLGVPGQIVLQAARGSGATVDRRRPGRRAAATWRCGSAPTGCSTRLRRRSPSSIKSETGGRGADVCIEVSGAPPALAEAMRTVAYASRVVAMGFFQGEARGLRLGDEFHHNRIELVSSQISGVAPEASHRWSKLRLWQTAVRLQHEGRLNLLPLITDEVPFDDAPALFAAARRGRSRHPAVGADLRAAGVTEPLRVALLGCGGIGARHAERRWQAAAANAARRVLRPRPGEDRGVRGALRRRGLHRLRAHARGGGAGPADRRAAALRA